MTRRLITFLGPTAYKTLTYALPGGNSTAKTPFVAKAIAELMDCDEVIVMATDLAWKSNGEKLATALGEIDRTPQRKPIPDGKNEAELREQFRALAEAIGEAQGSPVIDITHGFRAQPFFAATALATLAASGDLPGDTRITYGAMEATNNDGITPIWDLTPFLLLQELAHGIATLRHTGHGKPLIAALRRETERLSVRKLAGQREEFDRSNALVKAVEAFCNDLATLRVPALTIGQGRNGASSERLVKSIEKYRDSCERDHPSLLPLLDDLAQMASALPAGTLFGEEGQRAMVALARLYLQFNRPLEAAAVAREGYASLFAAGPEATDGGRPSFDKDARREAERRATATEAGSDIAGTRNDLLHAGMRKGAQSATGLIGNAKDAVEAFAQATPQPPEPARAPRSFFVTRHPGAIEWARRQGIAAEAIDHLDPENIRRGDTVIGTLPVHLAAQVCARGGRYLHLALDLPPEARGRDLTAEDMEKYGARLEEYRISTQRAPGARPRAGRGSEMKKIVTAYFWPIAAVAAYVLAAVLWHGWAYLDALWAFLEQPEWWAENTFTAIVFTVLVSAVVSIAARRRQQLERAPFERWTVSVSNGKARSVAPLDWEEVRRFRNSPLEERRLIQSIISSQGERLSTNGLDLVAQCDWVERDETKREYRIDMEKFCKSADRKPKDSQGQTAESGSENNATD